MDQVDPNSTRRRGFWATLAIAAVTGASAITIASPPTSSADPEPVPPAPPATTTSPPPATPTAAPAPGTTTTPPPGAPNTPQAQPADPNATPTPTDPNAPAPPAVDPNAGRIDNAVGGFSFVLPPGWVESDASHLDYGSELLSKTTGAPALPDQPPPVANDTRIVMGRLDQKLYASAEATNPKAAVRLGSDMGEFFMPYPGTRINQQTIPLNANGISGSASYYEVKFSDSTKPNGQIWTGVIGSSAATPPQRWFVVWLGTANDPVDQGAAKTLAESIRPITSPAATPTPASPAPGAPASPAPGAPASPASPSPAAPASPTPASPSPAAPAPAPGQAPAGEVTPTPEPTPTRTLPA